MSRNFYKQAAKQEEIAEEIKALERTQKILEKKQKQLLLSQGDHGHGNYALSPCRKMNNIDCPSIALQMTMLLRYSDLSRTSGKPEQYRLESEAIYLSEKVQKCGV